MIVDLMEFIVVALGGNALLDPSLSQAFSKETANMRKISAALVGLCKKDCRIVITHGNGSQIGNEVMRNEHAKSLVPKLPFYIINAETQAQIGTVVEHSLRNSLGGAKNDLGVCVILTHVLVDKNDPAFRNPTKQIGPLYNRKELDAELKLDRFRYIKIGSKYRRVIASPEPKRIFETDAIVTALKSNIVIACGGGGVPVVKRGREFVGVTAVIDKDRTTQVLANTINAKRMIILTNARYLYKNYGGKKEPMKEIRASRLKDHLDEFEEGTIRPKLEACITFIENGGKEAFIGNIFELDSILDRSSGTRIR